MTQLPSLSPRPKPYTLRLTLFLSTLILSTVMMSGCAPTTPPAPTLDVNAAQTQAFAAAYAALTQTAQAAQPLIATPAPQPTTVPSATPDPNRTPPPLPAVFAPSDLNPLDAPRTYIQDACPYLQAKWNPNNAAPGTVVMIIMIHGLSKGDPAKSQDMSVADFKNLMGDLHDQDFTAINTQQLFDFLDHNAKIPQRSVVLLQDDRHTAQNFNSIFRPYWEKWKWPVVNAWINSPDDIGRIYLPENVALSKEGWVDYQSHGMLHLPIQPGSNEDFIHNELNGAIQAMQTNFGKTPLAHIWAGGNFTPKAVRMARKAGFKLGFTINPRGPIMFNWVPQTDQADPMRPSYLPEGPAGDPLLTLPRYWNTDARAHLDTVRNIGKAAAAYAQQNKAAELEYYDILCGPTYGQISGQ